MGLLVGLVLSRCWKFDAGSSGPTAEITRRRRLRATSAWLRRERLGAHGQHKSKSRRRRDGLSHLVRKGDVRERILARIAAQNGPSDSDNAREIIARKLAEL